MTIAIPAIVSNISTPVLGLVDVAIAGHIGSAVSIGAIAVGSTMFNMLYWLFAFLRMSTAGLTSQSCGEDDFESSSLHLYRALLVAVISGLALIVFAKPIGYAALDFLDADDATAQAARIYFSILILGAPAVLGTYGVSGWLLGMQNSRTPMVIAIGTNLLNIALSATLVFGFDMGLRGVAMGSLFSQWMGFIAALIIIKRRYKPEYPLWSKLVERRSIGRLFKLNVDIFLRTLCLVAVTAWFTRAGASQGVDILAANALLMQFFMFFSYFTDGFAFAGEALGGKYYGAGKLDSLRLVVRQLLKCGAWLALLFSVIYFAGGDLLLRVMTDDSEVVDTAREYLPWAAGVPLCGMAAFIYDGIFVGLTLTRRMLVSLLASVVIFFGLYFAFYGIMGNHALWMAFLSYLLVRGITLHLIFPHRKAD